MAGRPDRLADQRAAERRGDRQAALLDVALQLADQLVGQLLVGVFVRQLDRRPELHGAARQLGDVDHLGAGDLVLQLHHPALYEALAVAGGMVFGVLRQVAVLAGLGDRPDDLRSGDGLQMLQLFFQPGEALVGHRYLVAHPQIPGSR